MSEPRSWQKLSPITTRAVAWFWRTNSFISWTLIGPGWKIFRKSSSTSMNKRHSLKSSNICSLFLWSELRSIALYTQQMHNKIRKHAVAGSCGVQFYRKNTHPSDKYRFHDTPINSGTNNYSQLINTIQQRWLRSLQRLATVEPQIRRLLSHPYTTAAFTFANGYGHGCLSPTRQWRKNFPFPPPPYMWGILPLTAESYPPAPNWTLVASTSPSRRPKYRKLLHCRPDDDHHSYVRSTVSSASFDRSRSRMGNSTVGRAIRASEISLKKSFAGDQMIADFNPFRP